MTLAPPQGSGGYTLLTQFTDGTRGDMLRRGASAWQTVAALTDAQFIGGNGTDAVLGALVAADIPAAMDFAKISLSSRLFQLEPPIMFGQNDVSGSGAVTRPTSTSNNRVELTTGATNGSIAKFSNYLWPSSGTIGPNAGLYTNFWSSNLEFVTVLHLDSITSSTAHVWIGTVAATTAVPAATDKCIGYRVTNGDLEMFVADGTTLTTTDTTFNLVVNTPTAIKIVFTSGTNITFATSTGAAFTTQATLSTNLPTGAIVSDLSKSWRITNGAAAAKILVCSYVYVMKTFGTD